MSLLEGGLSPYAGDVFHEVGVVASPWHHAATVHLWSASSLPPSLPPPITQQPLVLYLFQAVGSLGEFAVGAIFVVWH